MDRAGRHRHAKRALGQRHRERAVALERRGPAHPAQGRGNPLTVLRRLFAAEGPLAAHLPGYRPRPQQLEMAEAILAAIESGGSLVAEAGTGTGKTFAYLAPALLAGGKVIVS